MRQQHRPAAKPVVPPEWNIEHLQQELDSQLALPRHRQQDQYMAYLELSLRVIRRS